MSDLSHPAAVIARLAEIEDGLAVIENEFEAAALDWFCKKRDRDMVFAVAFDGTEGTVAERQALAKAKAATIGVDEEARWEALKLTVRSMEARGTIGQSILRAQGRS